MLPPQKKQPARWQWGGVPLDSHDQIPFLPPFFARFRNIPTKKTATLKMDGYCWKMKLSLLVALFGPIFRAKLAVSFQGVFPRRLSSLKSQVLCPFSLPGWSRTNQPTYQPQPPPHPPSTNPRVSHGIFWGEYSPPVWPRWGPVHVPWRAYPTPRHPNHAPAKMDVFFRIFSEVFWGGNVPWKLKDVPWKRNYFQ